jgi:colicin import membrane protein
VTRAHAAELEQLRADAARERDELRAAMESRAQVLEESRADLRARAERAERDLDTARDELARMRHEPTAAGATTPAPRRRGRPAEG